MANVFSTDPNCEAVFLFNNGLLTREEISGNNSFLTDVNTVGADTSDYKEGDAAATFNMNNDEYLTVTDANLPAGFPMKNGDTNKIISFSIWFKGTLDITSVGILSKGAINKRSILLYLSSGSDLYFYFGNSSGTAHEGKLLFSSIQANRWYCLGFAYNNSGSTAGGLANKAYIARLWDDTAGDFHAADASGSSTNDLNVEDGPFYIGTWGESATANDFGGKIDELAIFSDVLSTTEMDQIRAGTYGAGGGQIPGFMLLMDHFNGGTLNG